MGLQDDFDKETDLASDFDNEQDLGVRTPAQAPEATGGALETAGDTLRGAAQGVTFGLADELAGSIGAAGEVLSGQTELQNALEAYRRQRDESRAAYKAAEERSPTAFTTGNILGGIATAIPTAGLGAAAQGAGLAARLGSAAKVGAAAGGVAGLGTSEADLTQGDIGGVAADVASGIGTGAVFGVGTQGGMELVKGGAKIGGKVLDAIKDTETAQTFAKGYENPQLTLFTGKGREDIFRAANKTTKEFGLAVDEVFDNIGSLVGKGKDELKGQFGDISKSVDELSSLADSLEKSLLPENRAKGRYLRDRIKDLTEGLAKTKTVEEIVPGRTIKATKSAREKLQEQADALTYQSSLTSEPAVYRVVESPDGKFLSITKTLNDEVSSSSFSASKPVLNEPGTPEITIPPSIREKQIEVRSGGVNPKNTPAEQIQTLKEELNQATGVSQNVSGPLTAAGKATGQIQQIAGDLDKTLRKLSSSLANSNDKYTAVNQALEYLGLEAKELLVKDAATGQQRLTPGAFDKIIQKLSSAEDITKSGIKAEERLNEFFRLLRFADEEAVKKIEPKIRQTVTELNLAQKATGFNIRNPSTFIKAGAASVGNIAGKVAQSTSELAKAGTKKLSEATPEQLKQVVNAAMTKGGASMKVVQPLMDAMKKDNVGRNAALFSLQQNPEYREILKDLVSGDENEE